MQVEESEACRLLDGGVAVDLDVGTVPEVVQEGALLGKNAVPAGLPRRGERGARLVRAVEDPLLDTHEILYARPIRASCQQINVLLLRQPKWHQRQKQLIQGVA